MEAKWISLREGLETDGYGDFFTTFSWERGEVEIRICADSDYVLFLNGRFVNSDQYKDFPYCKVFDRIDLTPYLHVGVNRLAIVVWYYGKSNFSYFPGKAGLWFCVQNGRTTLAVSDARTLSRPSRAYRSGAKKEITVQLGFRFSYAADREDSWKDGVLDGFSESAEDDRPAPQIERPIKKLRVEPRVESHEIRTEGCRRLFDLGHEEVGYLTLCITSDRAQSLRISWGEHIEDGWVRSRIHDRDFSVEVTVGAGETDYTNYFRRMGARYLEIESAAPIGIGHLSLLPCPYPLEVPSVSFGDDVTDRIYQTAVRTLALCMHDHYEDCPWREQAMYGMDSRNQMLCGYYAFHEFDFPRACLWLMAQDDRADGLLSICVPTDHPTVIPSFALHYLVAVCEYTEHSGDLSLAREILPKLESILSVFLARMQNGLVPTFPEHWDFYEWTDGLNGRDKTQHEDAALNCLLSITLDRMQILCDQLGKVRSYRAVRDTINQTIRKRFYDEECGLFRNRADKQDFSELVNSLAILSGAAEGAVADRIAKLLIGENDLTQISLSMTCFLYDACLAVDRKGYRDLVLADIRKTYLPMLEAGATSFWETQQGAADFHGAGSLCHGWSAMPIYYYHTLLERT